MATYANKVKLFGKWSFEDINVDDVSLIDFISVQAKDQVYVPHTAGRYQVKRFRKAQCPIVERLINALMRRGRNNGKKLTGLRIVQQAFEIIHLTTEENPLQVFVRAIINAGPREDSTRIGAGGIVRRQAVDVSPFRRVNQALYNIGNGVREASFRTIKSVAEILADEIVNAAKGSSNSYAIKKKDEIERVAKVNRKMAHNLQSLLPSLMKRHLSIAKQIDKISPHLKNYLFSGQGSFPLLPEPGILTHDLDVARLIRAYAEIECEKQGNHTLYVPPSSLYDIVRDAYRRKPGDPAPSSTFPIELDNSIDVRIDAAYNNLFDLLTITNVNNELVESGYLNVEKMGNYIHKNITERSEVRPGSLLVEHPATVYSGSGLVYVHDIAKNIQEIHGNEEWRIRGFFCNYPTHKTVNDYWDVGKNTAFAQLPVFWGGNGNDLYILHRFPNIEAAQVIGDPETDGDCLCVGAVIDSVNEMLENGSASPEDFKVIRGSWESPLVETSDGIEWPESVEWRVAAGRGALDIAMHPPILPPVGMFPNDVTEEASGDFNFVQTYHISKTWSHVVYALAVNNVSVLYESIEADKRPQFPDPYEFPDEFIYAVQDYSLIDSRYKKAFELLHWKYNHSGLAHYLKERRPHQIANFVDNYLAASEAATQQTAESEEPVYKEREPMKFK